MSAHQFATLGIRIFLLWYFVTLIRGIPPSLSAIYRENGFLPIGFIVGTAISVLLGCLLWFFSTSIARLFVPESSAAVSSPWSEKQLITIGCSLIGLSVMVYELHSLIYHIAIWYLSHSQPISTVWHPENSASFFSTTFVFAIGMWLFWGSNGVWRLWSTIRSNGN